VKTITAGSRIVASDGSRHRDYVKLAKSLYKASIAFGFVITEIISGTGAIGTVRAIS
jgi:hypothetical protein